MPIKLNEHANLMSDGIQKIKQTLTEDSTRDDFIKIDTSMKGAYSTGLFENTKNKRT